MKKLLGIFVVVLSALTVFVLTDHTRLDAEEYNLSSDPRLEEAKTSFVKAEDYMERAHSRLKSSPGQAQKLFEHAEDYFSKAGFLYKELGYKNDIDVTDEVKLCKERESRAHVMVNKARNKWRHSGAF